MAPNYYTITPASVRYDKNLSKSQIVLYGEITALCNKEGFCWASNDYFAELYEVDVLTVSRWISGLKKHNHISVEITQTSVNKRKIYLQNTVATSIQNNQELLTKTSRAIDENVNGSIYSINNTINTVGSGLNFILKKYPIRFEQEFLMAYENQFKTQDDFDRFLKDFNDEVEIKDKPYGSWLMGMLKKYSRNWLAFKADKRQMRVVKDEENNVQSNKHLENAI